MKVFFDDEALDDLQRIFARIIVRCAKIIDASPC
jgi:hypothetical protein